jgi:LysM repeat protein
MTNAMFALRAAGLLGAVLVAAGVVLASCWATVDSAWATVRASGDPATALPAAVVLVAAATFAAVSLWLALCVSACLAEAGSGGRWRPLTGLSPRAVRLLVGVVAGSALAAGTATAADRGGDAAGSPAESLAGLRLPERTTGEVRHPPASGAVRNPPATGSEHVVEPGDTLWGIAARLLPSGSPTDVDRGWRTLYRANQRRVGADPDLIHPGTALRVPATLHASRSSGDTDERTDDRTDRGELP